MSIALRQPEALPEAIVAETLPGFRKLQPSSRARSLELDMIRGMALFVMLSDHLMGNPWAVITSRPLGLFSGADVFVFASGMAAGLKYYGSYAAGGMTRVWSGVVRSWVILLATCAILRIWSNLSGILYSYVVFWGLIVVLAPVCARGWRKTVLAVTFLGWLAAFFVPLPAPFDRWVFNPLSWQLLFSAGFLFGQPKPAAPDRCRAGKRSWCWPAIAVACFSRSGIRRWTRPGWLFNGSPCIGPLRLLDFLAVAYLCYHLVRVPERLAKPFASVGRHGLWVFVWVTVLVAAWEFWKLPSGPISPAACGCVGMLASLWLVVPDGESD